MRDRTYFLARIVTPQKGQKLHPPKFKIFFYNTIYI